MNTYGLHSINNTTFNARDHGPLTYSKQVRDTVMTLLKINNAVLNILGYMQFVPIVSVISGSLRMAVGTGIVLTTLLKGDRNAAQGNIAGHLYDEALLTGISQIARGILEAFVPFGWAVNIVLDVVATPINLFYSNTPNWVSSCQHCFDGIVNHGQHRPHADPLYDSGPVYYLLNLA